ncbi:hypothetical protein EVAR_97728_1 [Eumeta japonica]|uniref:Uncharacterized protein n=1 Tax=Eumeta variegata TaxID=151549 RepID=A0A4C1Y0K2_EUMVA|nr:hypothetical protein EVAR_97728_1 [Eumeta japonica]
MSTVPSNKACLSRAAARGARGGVHLPKQVARSVHSGFIGPFLDRPQSDAQLELLRAYTKSPLIQLRPVKTRYKGFIVEIKQRTQSYTRYRPRSESIKLLEYSKKVVRNKKERRDISVCRSHACVGLASPSADIP